MRPSANDVPATALASHALSCGSGRRRRSTCFLAVGDLRPDGYHDLVTVFHAVDLADELTIESAARHSVRTTPADGVPAGAKNLAGVAARLLAKRTGAGGPVAIDIAKQIPVAGGMAGGSADAAATLVGCAALWGLDMARGDLAQIGAEIGADVPFALTGGTAVGTGRGDLLSPVLARTPLHWVLALADEGLSTPAVFAELDRLRDSANPGRRSRRGSVSSPTCSPRWPVAIRPRWRPRSATTCRPAAFSLQPGLRRTLRAGLSAGALAGVVSGSGPTIALLCADAEVAGAVAAELAGSGTCRTVRVAVRPGARCPGRRRRVGSQTLMANLVNIEAASVTHGIRTVLDRVSLGVQTGDRIGVLGLNGSGKTTLLRLLAGLDAPDTGRVSSQRGTTVAFVSQSTDLPPESTVRDAVLHTFGDAEHAWASDSAVRAVLTGLGLAGHRPGFGRRHAVRRRAAAGGARRRAGHRRRSAAARRADQPSGHRGGGLARRRTCGIDRARWSPSPTTAGSSTPLPPPPGRWSTAAVLGREGGYSDWVFARAERLRLDQAAEETTKEPGAQGVGLAAPRPAGAHVEAPVPDRGRRGDHRR